MRWQLATDERYRLHAAFLAEDVILEPWTLSLVDGHATLQVREAKGGGTVAAVGCAQRIKQCVILCNA
jgi:hypothetical protein